ncbi:Tetracycline resistance protein from transposon [Wallemia ichthyophaga EXF-994]|uniref:Tetracycline resistance protein from transposon n=1 Tax=Wallemia ichthyophaga (strain EXF-994 / CBS 113033) TaxID=1299270 RepID=R9A9P7_WALI9|nr:Tetracycline resistance protein from transposon [Wallemia ichthyophaga EXF-994]EOQ98948.1 Tetracycline resistance protein from transposon [Wallemia ichthyophaga EXF-994]TIA81018.1 hypothetical protein E3P98_02281 [Wallemia ichthyophaga]TIB33019.1 hypothetical protein E3P84_02309 [Wallemia ichthyophaga]TIB41162.1 hypothetical protein E3P83_02262 [Wallemia ichthyophaga]
MTKKLAIIGAGPAGLCLANTLIQHTDLDVQVFERDAHINAKPQGGSLDVHVEAQEALRAAGVYEQFALHARCGDQEDVILDKHASKHVHMRAESGYKNENENNNKNKPEIDRTALRHFLCDALPEGVIRWDTKVDKVEQATQGSPATIHFDGNKHSFDLVVGADGAWSKVRPLLHTIPPFYSGVSCYEGNLRDASVKQAQEDFSDVFCNGTTFILAETDGLMVIQKNSGDCYKVYVYKSKPEAWAREAGIEEPSALRAAMLDDIKDWSPKLHGVVRALNIDIFKRAMYMLPSGIMWESKPSITVVGDAASLQTPFAGQGVNLALIQAHKLAQSLVSHKENQLLAVQDYEKWMHDEANSKMTLTWTNLQMFMNKGAIAKLKQFVA